MKKYWTVVYYLYNDKVPVTEHFATRKEARRFKKALKLAPKFYKEVSMRRSCMTALFGFVVSPIKEY
jgi:hypothetical protein